MPTIFAPERIPFTPTASGRQKSPRVGRGGPRLVERSPTPSPRFSSGLRRRFTLIPVRSSIQDWLVHRRLRGGKSLLAWAAAAQGSSSVRRPLRLPFPVGATTLHADFSALKHPILVGTPTASGRQKSPRVGRSGPRLVERSPTPSPPLFQWAATTLHTGFSALSEKPPTLWRGVRRRTRALRWEECSAVIR